MWTMQFLILIAGAYADRSDNIYPQNLAVIVGEPVSFLCGTMSSEKVIIWKVKKIGKLVEELISTGFNVTKAYQSANFSIGQSKTGNNYVLQMNHVELDDAGTYKCILTGSRESVTGIGTAQLVVLDRPKSVNIDPRKETYINGEVIRCNADGNPSPSYAWKDIGSNVVASLNSTLVVNVKRMHNRTYECTATNNGGSISTSITFRLDEGISKHGTNLITGVTIFAGVLCAVLGVVVVALTIKRIAESCQWTTDIESPSGPDIVQNAEVSDPLREEQQFDGYAQAEDLGIERPFIRYAGNGTALETKREVPVPRCAFGTVLGGNPIYDEINSEVKADAVVSEPEKTRLEFPVYGKVNKSVKDGISSATVPPEEFPAYGKVRKITHDRIQDFLESCNPLSPMLNPEEAEEGSSNEALEDTASQRRVIVGADGTEYMDMSAVRRLMQPENHSEISAQSPEFTISQYAQIDHSHTS